MNINYILIAAEWIIVTCLLLRFIPKNKLREASVAFFFKQSVTWLLGLCVVQLRLIEYPIRLFSYSTKASFSFEYFTYPSLCAIFNIHYPTKKSFFGQFMYYFYYCTSITILEVIVEKHTEILKYIHWTWYITWITLCMTFFITRMFYVWFFKLKANVVKR